MKKRVLMYGALTLGVAGLLPGAVIAQDRSGIGQDRSGIGIGQSRPVGDIPGPIDSIQDLQDTAKMLFKMADTNNDGQISQKEATDVGNLLVGGFFFRADANGDGTLTPEESRAAREALFQQQPLLRYIVQKAKPNNGGQGAGATDQPGQPGGQNPAANPGRAIANLLDSNHDQRIQAAELRQAVQTSVQTLFTIADANQDGQLSPAEPNPAIGEAARTAVQVTFQNADADRNGALSMAEFDRALTEPAHAAFRVLDSNNDNQLSLEELQKAQQVIADQIRRLRTPDTGNTNARQAQAVGTPTTNAVSTSSPGIGTASPPVSPAPAPAPPQ